MKTVGVPILVVDDERGVRELIVSTLRAHLGAAVVEADCCESALRWVVAVKFACVVTDVEMPDRDGCDLIRDVRADPRTRALPIVAISGGLHRADALAAGADAYLAKPFSPAALAAEVARRLDGRSGARSLADG
jgi:two-component system chemotaxis response regulator CheY